MRLRIDFEGTQEEFESVKPWLGKVAEWAFSGVTPQEAQRVMKHSGGLTTGQQAVFEVLDHLSEGTTADVIREMTDLSIQEFVGAMAGLARREMTVLGRKGVVLEKVQGAEGLIYRIPEGTRRAWGEIYGDGTS